MAFKDFAGKEQGVTLLQRSLERGRLGHGYLFSGHSMEELEKVAISLAKTLNCQRPVRARSGAAIDCCDRCVNCLKIDHGNHADVYWARPEAKSRVIVIDQVRELMRNINLKPTEADYKVAIICGADRLNVHAANAFLKTLEEPPGKSILILLTTEPQRILETILSRCLRLNIGSEHTWSNSPYLEWLGDFAAKASEEQKSLMGRYRLLDVLLKKLTDMKSKVEEAVTTRSPLSHHDDPEPALKEKWEVELTAAVEAEYRRQRSDLLLVVQAWLRDLWITTLSVEKPGVENRLLSLPKAGDLEKIASRITPRQAVENLDAIERLQRLLNANVQEALALEVSLLKLHL